MATSKANQVRVGNVLILESELFLVTGFEHIAPGNWRAINQIRCKNLQTGSTKQLRLGSDEVMELAYLERRPATFSFMEVDRYVFMDAENFEQYFLGADMVADAMKYVRDNQKVTITLHDGVPISIELPSSVVLQVKEADVAARGDTVTNEKKRAVLETGIEIKVPPFIEAGEFVRVSTETNDFLGRAKPEEAA
jgi:elongation factor P